MKTRILSIMLVICLVITLFPIQVLAGEKSTSVHVYWGSANVMSNPATPNPLNPGSFYCGYVLVSWPMIQASNPGALIGDYPNLIPITATAIHKLTPTFISRMLSSFASTNPSAPPPDYLLPVVLQGGHAVSLDAGDYVTDGIVGVIMYMELTPGHNAYGYFPAEGYAPPGYLAAIIGMEANGTVKVTIGNPLNFIETVNVTGVKSSVPVSGSNVFVGSTITYYINVTNTETLTGDPSIDPFLIARNTIIKDVIPAGATYVPGTATLAGAAVSDATVYNAATRTLTWTIPALNPQQTIPVSFQVTANALPAGALTGTIDNFAVVNTTDTNHVFHHVQQIPYPIGVIKQDAVSGLPLAGVVFKLYAANKTTVLETLPATNASGYAQSVNTYAPGVYYLKEFSTVPGYVLNPDFNEVTVTVNQAGGVAIITVGNARTPYPIQVLKLDDVSSLPLAGVVFDLYNSSKTTVLETLPATDAAGLTQTVNTYAPGTYYIKEKTTIAGYVLNTNFYEVIVSINQAGGKATVTVRNARTPYPVQVLKLDDVSGLPLAGVIFDLYNTAKTSVLETLPATDAAGLAQTVSTYTPGTYYIKEKTTITGYVLNPNFYEVVIGIGQAGGKATVTVRNARTPYPIQVLKLDDVSGLPLAGVVFDLYNTAKTSVLETLPATGAAGYAQTIGSFAPGTYYVKEKTTISGYVLNPNFYEVVIGIGQIGGKATVTVRNSRTPYPVQVLKLDDVSGLPLAGVVFDLYNAAKTSVLETLPATGAAGYAQTIGSFAPGTYYVKEAATIAGYVLNPNFYEVVIGINQAGGKATVTVRNSRTPYPVQVLKLDDVSGLPLAGVVFDLYNTAKTTVLETLPATDTAGYAQTVGSFAPGTYYIKEKTTITGYVLNPNFFEVVIGINQAGGKATVTVRNSRTPYPVQVLKLDDVSGLPLAGVVFDLYNSAKTTVLETLPATDAAGYAQTLGSFAPGTYYVKESSTINGYVLNPNFHEVVVAIGQAGGKATVTVRNSRTPYPVQVLKLDDVSGLPLAGVVFDLYNSAKTTVLETLPATNATGYAQTIGSFAPGTYYIKEQTTIAGYLLNPSFYEVVVGIGQAGGKATVTVRNARTPYPIEILKLDAVSGLPLAGVVFRIYQEVLGIKVALPGDLTTNISGIATSAPLAPGNYFVKEFSVPNGYELDTTYYPVAVNINQAGGKATVTVRDARTPYPIEVLKLDDTSSLPLAGVVFDLYNASKIYITSFPATDATGLAQTVNSYAPGTYFVKEASTINGYELNSNFYEVVVAIGQAGGKATVTVRDARTPYPIEVLKLDAVSGLPLAGSVFDLYNAAKTTVLETLPATGATGYAQTVSNYAPGTYYVKEKTASSGYALNPNFYEVLVGIGQTGGKATVTVRNSRTPYPVQVLKLDDVSGLPLAGVIFDLYNAAQTTVLETLPATSTSGYAQTLGSFAPGTYYVKEKATINGYALNPNFYEVVIGINQAGGKATVTVRNARTPYPIEILKLDAVSGLPLAGVVFRIYQEVLGIKVALPGDLTTNASGITTSAPLAPGNYFVQEYSVPDGYELDSTYYPVTVNINQAGGKATVTVRDARTPYPVEVLKLDDISGLPLAGVVFDLYNNGKTSVLETLPATDTTGLTQSANSYAPGTYYVKEKTTISGYELNPNFYEIVIAIGQAGGKTTVTVRNTRTPYPIEVLKLDDISGLPLAGVVFDLYNTAQTTVLETLPATNAAGLAQTIGSFAPGTYYVKEKTTINGYVLNPNFHEVVINVNQVGGKASVTVRNARTPYLIEINKLDGRDETTPLGGAIFELHAVVDSDGKLTVGSLLETLTTNSLGQAITSMPYAPGQYFLIEKTAPSGFYLINDPILVTMAVGSGVDGIFTVYIMNNFIFTPSIVIDKLVANVTRPSVFADLADLYVDETARYSVVVTNNGNALLTDVILTDDRAIVGTSVTNVTAGTTLTWEAGVGGIATLVLGDLDVNESITLTYDYVTVALDITEDVIINTAAVSGLMIETPDFPNGKMVSDDDSASIIVTDIPLNQAGIKIDKLVQNLNLGGDPADMSSGVPGHVFRYTVKVTNTGMLDLSLVKLTDDHAVAGTTVTNVTAGTTTTWLADGSNPAYLMIGDLVPGQSVIFIYDYTSQEADLAGIRINTADVDGTVTITLDDPNVVVIGDDDTASISVEQIPLTGETGASALGGLILLFGAASLILFNKRMRRTARLDDEADAK